MNTVFASIELAARIDRAEARLSASLGREVVGRNLSAEAFVDEIGGGVAVYTAPSSPVNKMIGVGFDGIPADGGLAAIEEKFSRRGAPLQAEVATLADPAFAAHLTRRGYALLGFENVLGRPIAPPDGNARTDGDIEIALIEQEQTEHWLQVGITGFLHPDTQGVQAEPLPLRETLEGVMRDLAMAPGFRRYFARIGGEIAGVATMRLDRPIAQLCGAATLPAFRRRGVQTALLRRRLADAFDAGCDLAALTTQPGSRSQENGHRQGFALLYSRALLVKDPRGPSVHSVLPPDGGSYVE